MSQKIIPLEAKYPRSNETLMKYITELNKRNLSLS